MVDGGVPGRLELLKLLNLLVELESKPDVLKNALVVALFVGLPNVP